MAEKNTSKRPSVVGRKVKVSKAPAPAYPADKAEAPAPSPSQDPLKDAARRVPRPSVPAGKKAKSSLNVETDSVSEKTGTPRKSASGKKKRRLSRRFVIIACSIVVVLAVATGLLSWNQWFRYDDSADIQGTWVVDGSDVAITVTDSQIQMNSDVAYSYSLDTFNKTISFSFGKYSGSGCMPFLLIAPHWCLPKKTPMLNRGKLQPS